jgi:hypothetical protein
MLAETQTITKTAINTKLLKDIASFLDKQVSEHKAILNRLENKIIELARNCSEIENLDENIRQGIADITKSFYNGYCADIQTNYDSNEQATKLENCQLKCLIEKARKATIKDKKAREAGIKDEEDRKADIKSIETIINYSLAQEIFKKAVVTKVTDEPILAGLDIPGTRVKPEFYKISTQHNHYSLLIGYKNEELLIQQNQISDRLQAILAKLPELEDMLDLVAKTEIWRETNTLIKDYSPCSRLTIPHAKKVAIYRINPNITNSGQAIIAEKIFEPTLISDSNQIVIKVNQEINTLKQMKPNSILLVLESLYIPDGLNTDIEMAIIHNKRTQKLEIRPVSESNEEQIGEEQIGKMNTTCMEIEHKIGEDWISPRCVLKEIESILKPRNASGNIKETEHTSEKQTKVGASIRKAIGSIFTEKSPEIIHVNLLDSKNPVQKVLGLDLEGRPKADKIRLRLRGSYETQA